jgi:hypothetical protein
LLSKPLAESQNRLVALDVSHLRAVQLRRELPTRAIQAAQSLMQRRVLAVALGSDTPFGPPLAMRLLLRVPILRDIPGRMVAFGLWPSRIKKGDYPAAAIPGEAA